MTENDQATRVSSSSLVAVAWVLSFVQAFLDFGSRSVRISAIPAFAALQICIVVTLVLLFTLVLRVIEARKVQGSRKLSDWPLVVALVASLCALLGRVAISPLEPTVFWLAPVLLVAPGVLTWELAVMYRSGSRLTGTAWLRFVATWSTIAAICTIAFVIGPARWNQIDVRSVGLQWLGWSLLLGASSAVLYGVVQRSWETALRFLLLAVSSLALLLPAYGPTWFLSSSQALRLFPLIGAFLILLAMFTPRWAVARVMNSVAKSGLAVTTYVGRVFLLASELFRRVSRCLGRPWRRLLEFASFPRVTGPRTLTRQHVVGAWVMGVISVGFIAHGMWWAHSVGWQPTGHAATLMMRAAQVGTVDHPLLGLVTSLGSIGKGSHLGPLPMDLLAPFVRVFGVRMGALVGASAFTLLCWAVSVWAAWRAAGGMAALAAWVTAAMVIAVPALGAFWEGNNISLSLLAILATLMASWAAASGTPRAWWWAVGLGSFCAQSYIPHALVIIGPVLWAGLVLAGSRRREPDPTQQRSLRNVVRVGWLIAAVAWLQPALDAVLHQGGNVRYLFAEVSHPQPNVGVLGFPRAIAWVLAVPPRWAEITQSLAQAGSADLFIRGSLILGLILAALLILIWWRTRSTATNSERQLRIITLLVLLGAGLNATQLPQDFLRSFQLGWLVVVSLFVWFSVLLSMFLALREPLSRRVSFRWGRALRAGAFSLSVVAVIALSVAGPDRIEEVKERAFTIDALIDPLVEQTLTAFDSSEAVFVPQAGGRLNEIATDTILSNLIVGGLNARVETSASGMNYGERRMVTQWSGPTLWITSALSPIKPGGKLLASASAPDWSEERYRELSEQVATRVSAAPKVRLQPWTEPYLVRYLSGWIPENDLCATAEQLRAGTYPIASLPPGLLLTLYADLAVSAPRLPASMQDEVSGVMGQGPLEVWQTEIEQPVQITTNLLRNGTACPQSTGPS